MRRVVIGNEPDGAFRRIVTVQVLQQRNKFSTNGMQARLFIERDGDYGQRPVVRPAPFVLKGYLLIFQQDIAIFSSNCGSRRSR
jgi:hypothetical protein